MHTPRLFPLSRLNTLMASGIMTSVLLVGCGSSDEPSDTATPTASPMPTPTPNLLQCNEGSVPMDGACVASLPDGWSQIFPKGDTICARGTEFSYFVHPGTVNKLVLGFDGGGACWDALSCSKANPTFSEEVSEGDDPTNLTDGLLDYADPENPFKDWFAIFIPYCTGDIHWGDNVATYTDDSGNETVIQHKGFINGTAVLDWTYDHFSKPETVFITGVSAGSYGSIAFAPYVMEHYSDSRVVQVGDCGAGVVTQDFLATGITNWDAQKNFPLDEIKYADLQELTLNDVYIAVGNAYPDQIISQYNTANDENQRYYYELMSGDGENWSAIMFQYMDELEAEVPNFRYYVAGGDKHGILPYPEFYTYTVGDKRIRDWVSDLVLKGDAPNVRCTSCDAPEIYSARQAH